MNGYDWDIFISYPRRAPAGEWVQRYFHVQLDKWLPETTPLQQNPRIFIDRNDIAVGDTWPLAIQSALLRSKLLVPIFCPSFFRSPWCCAELESMLERERILGYRTHENPTGLIFPICFSDGQHFPEPAQHIQRVDMRSWNISEPVFKDTPKFVEFVQAIQTFADELGNRLSNVPQWQQDWPIINPPVSTIASDTVMQLPRIQ